MSTPSDTRNWDQKELDEARAKAARNVVSEGASVPNAARLNADRVLDTAEPSPVLKGDRPTSEDERETVEAQGIGAVIPSNGANEVAGKEATLNGDKLFKDSEKNADRTDNSSSKSGK